MTEKALQRKILVKLSDTFGGTWVNTSPGPYDKRGIADILGVCHGKAFAIELKRPGAYKEPHEGCSEAQRAFLRKWNTAGGVALVADSWEAVYTTILNSLVGTLPGSIVSKEKMGAKDSRRVA